MSCFGQRSLPALKPDYVELTAFTLNLKIGAQEASSKEDFEELSLQILKEALACPQGLGVLCRRFGGILLYFGLYYASHCKV